MHKASGQVYIPIIPKGPSKYLDDFQDYTDKQG